jgi:hypothetical protein
MVVLRPPKLVEEVRLKVLDLFLNSNRDERCQIGVHEDRFVPVFKGVSCSRRSRGGLRSILSLRRIKSTKNKIKSQRG